MANPRTEADIQIAIATWLGIRRNLIVPNVSWGLMPYECDILCLSKAGYATEYEVKISRADLIRDQKKMVHRNQNNNMICELWFAMPTDMWNSLEFVPVHAGAVLVSHDGRCEIKRHAIRNPNARKWTEKERYKLARLGAIRIWALKEKIVGLQNMTSEPMERDENLATEAKQIG